MIQIKKTILTLALLLTAVTGAWADGTVTVTEIKASEMPTSWGNNNNPVKATDLPGFTAVTRDDAKALGAPAAEGDIYVFYAIFNNVFMGLHWNNGVLDDSDGAFSLGGIYALQDVFKFYYVAAAPSGPEVAWTAASNTGTFKMPGGNVTLEPEYYPQATVADGGVTAADADARATTDDPLVKVDATKLTGAKKLMYFVSNSGTTAPAYDAEGWTDQLPNAEGFTQQGIVYVWYYPVGTDEGVDGATATYSDGDICLQSITARIADAPTYAVTFAEGTDPNEWTASPNAGVTKGTEVTVTYSGTKKVIGVKAEKKAEAPAVKITSFSLQGPSSLDASDYATISIVNIVPSNATNQTFTWSTSGDISIFEVSNETKTCVVRSGENVGEASVTATANDGSGVSYTLNITIIGDN